MSRMAPLDGTLWFGLSAERFDTSAKHAESSYPPYNVELAPGEEAGLEILRITLAVAGFGRDELNVLIENGELLISGTKREEGPRDYLHRGIATRHFKRTFALAKGVEVRKAELHEGLLAIELERSHREKRVTKVGITPTG